MIWTPAPEWRGKRVYVLAPGPSLDLVQVHAIARARLADRCRVIAVNDATLVCWFADIAFAADRKWWKNRGDLARFPGRRVTLKESYQDAPFDQVQRVAAEGYDPRPGLMCTHSNSGAMAVQLAAHLDAESIVLVGFDMRSPSDEAGKPVTTQHFFGEYEPPLQAKPNMARWVEMFRPLADALAGRLFNATPGSALDFVPAIDLAAI